MKFEKTYIYRKELTIDGVKEEEKDTRNPKTIEENNILKNLPEFTKTDNEYINLLDTNKINKLNENDNEDDAEDIVNDYLYKNDNDYFRHNPEDIYNEHEIEKEKEIFNELKKNIKNYAKQKKEKEIENEILNDNFDFKELKKNIKKKTIIKQQDKVKAIIKMKKKQKENDNNNDNSKLVENLPNIINEEKNENKKNLNYILSGYSDISS